MAKDLDVVARLRLFTGNAQRKLERLSGNLNAVANRTKKADSYMSRFAKRAAAIGAMYLGFRAINSALHNVVGGAFEFQRSIEQTKIGLQTMIQNIENVSFERAAEGADYLWRKLQLLSIQSVATTKELHEAFAGSYGPMRAAGAQMDDILETSRNLVHAAGALGIDMPQAIRDLGLMATGRAMAQVKLFQRLRTSGFLKGKGGEMMSAEEWNKLAAPERTQRLIDVLSKFEEAGGAAAKTLSGRLSTLLDLYQNIRANLFEAVFGKFADSLGTLNKWLIANYARLEAYFSGLGNRLRSAVGPAFDRIGARLAYFGDNFELIIDGWIQRVGEFINMAQKLAPIFAKMAAAWAVFSASRAIVGAGAMVGGKLAAVGAATAGGAAAAKGGGMMAMMGGGFSAMAGALTPLISVMSAVAIVAGFLASIWFAVKANMEPLLVVVDNMRASFAQLWPVLSQTFGTLWEIMKEIFTAVGTMLMLPLPAGADALRMWVDGLRIFLEDVQIYLNKFLSMVQEARVFWTELFGGEVKKRFRPISKPEVLQRTEIPEIKEPQNIFGEKTPGARAQVVNDFRGSKITLKQEFRQADPDRIAIQMMEDLARFAEQRVTSGFVPATTG